MKSVNHEVGFLTLCQIQVKLRERIMIYTEAKRGTWHPVFDQVYMPKLLSIDQVRKIIPFTNRKISFIKNR
jgi:hypothetical protein